jgi:hypothetical protein
MITSHSCTSGTKGSNIERRFCPTKLTLMLTAAIVRNPCFVALTDSCAIRSPMGRTWNVGSCVRFLARTGLVYSPIFNNIMLRQQLI